MLVAGPTLFALTGMLLQIPTHPLAGWCAATAIWMVLWWISEVVPLATTSLLPLVLFPILGIMSGKETASAYINPVIFLFIGGFLVAIAMQRWNLHRRIALFLLLRSAGSPQRMLLGFMSATALLSMWISNTATTMMMVPIALAVLKSIRSDLDKREGQMLAVAMLLGIAYAASIGGIATLVGTPPNLSLARILTISFPDAPELAFNQWMVLALPIALALFVVAFLLLSHRYLASTQAPIDIAAIQHEMRHLGSMRGPEVRVAVVFILLALLWLFRADLHFGSHVLHGWAHLMPEPAFINDGVVAIFMALWLFLLPGEAERKRLLDGSAFRDIPWDIVLLFGGGFALATGIRDSGLALWIAEQSSDLAALPPIIIVSLLCLGVTFMTELTSNTATAETLLPIVAAVSVALGIHPLLLMIPATISCSLAFMLPVATPPNAIVFGSGQLRVRDMARTGLLLNLAGVLLVTIGVVMLGPWAFDTDFWQLPSWAHLN
ncbi:MAG: SLC13/DASS family transporter [Zetaproteobacteria bacterium]|nr:MAG: SLC13/DASS family transporter [Zetaproteobacteria bacterium]